MDRPRILRLLRIAFSAVCGIVCLLMIALWVRSYWWSDYFHVPLPIPNVLTVHSMYGTTDWYLKSSKFSRIWTIESNTVARETEGIGGPNPWLRTAFLFSTTSSRTKLSSLGAGVTFRYICCGPMAPLPLLPPHSANRHDARCRRAGTCCGDGPLDVTAKKLSAKY